MDFVQLKSREHRSPFRIRICKRLRYHFNNAWSFFSKTRVHQKASWLRQQRTSIGSLTAHSVHWSFFVVSKYRVSLKWTLVFNNLYRWARWARNTLFVLARLDASEPADTVSINMFHSFTFYFRTAWIWLQLIFFFREHHVVISLERFFTSCSVQLSSDQDSVCLRLGVSTQAHESGPRIGRGPRFLTRTKELYILLSRWSAVRADPSVLTTRVSPGTMVPGKNLRSRASRAFALQHHKIQMCTFHTVGRCGMRRCGFVHGEAWLEEDESASRCNWRGMWAREKVFPITKRGRSTHDIAKSQRCHYFEKGDCRKALCKFVYEAGELRDDSSTNKSQVGHRVQGRDRKESSDDEPRGVTRRVLMRGDHFSAWSTRQLQAERKSGTARCRRECFHHISRWLTQRATSLTVITSRRLLSGDCQDVARGFVGESRERGCHPFHSHSFVGVSAWVTPLSKSQRWYLGTATRRIRWPAPQRRDDDIRRLLARVSRQLSPGHNKVVAWKDPGATVGVNLLCSLVGRTLGGNASSRGWQERIGRRWKIACLAEGWIHCMVWKSFCFPGEGLRIAAQIFSQPPTRARLQESLRAHLRGSAVFGDGSNTASYGHELRSLPTSVVQATHMQELAGAKRGFRY